MNLWGLVIAVFLLLLLLTLLRAHLSGKNDLSLLDLVTRDGKLSMTAILQLVGGVVGTWIMVKLTVSGALTYEMFLVYLGYVASVDGFSKFVSARYSSGDTGYRYQRYDTYQRPGSQKTEPIE